MYSPKIEPKQVKRLYRIKISRLRKGEKGTTMTGIVKEALGKYLPKEEKKQKENGGLVQIGSPIPGGN